MSDKILNNPRHHFGYVQLPSLIDTLFPEDKEEICWAPWALIEREIYKSEVDVMFRIGLNGRMHYMGKVTEIKTGVAQRFIRIDTTACEENTFELLREYVQINRPVYQHRPFLTGIHIDNFISGIHLEASTLREEETGRPLDTVLNKLVITLTE